MMKNNLNLFLGVLVLSAFWIFAGCAQKVVLQSAPAAAKPQPKQMNQAQEPEKHEEADFSVGCVECHQEETPEEVQDWSMGMHGQVNVGCFVCHGDGEEEFYSEPTGEQCISCHSGYFREVANSGEEFTCFTCHDGHTLKFHSPEAATGFGQLLPSH